MSMVQVREALTDLVDHFHPTPYMRPSTLPRPRCEPNALRQTSASDRSLRADPPQTPLDALASLLQHEGNEQDQEPSAQTVVIVFQHAPGMNSMITKVGPTNAHISLKCASVQSIVEPPLRHRVGRKSGLPMHVTRLCVLVTRRI